MTGTVRVALADDHPLFLSGLCALVERTDGLELAGAARDGEGVVELVASVGCDVALVDLRMPGVDGVEATRRIAAAPGAPAVVVLTMVEDGEALSAAVAAGARGYVLKGADSAEIVAAVRTAAAGGVVFGAAVAARVLDRLRTTAGAAPVLPQLAEQERRVLDLLAGGRPTSAIAVELALAPKTVRNYLSNAYAKLGVADRYEAIALARRHGLGR